MVTILEELAVLIHILTERGAIRPPNWLPSNVYFLAEMGSVAFGASSGDSDKDMQGFCIPPKDLIFGHAAGFVQGFGEPFKPWETFHKAHVPDPDGRPYDYDITIWSIVKFCELCRESNANTLDVLFAPQRCIRHSTPLAEHLRSHRRLFLNKQAMHRLRGYAFSQMRHVKNKTGSSNPDRQELIRKFGYDTKFGYHAVRLCLQAEQILVEHDLDLERNSEILKSVRRGEWTLDELDRWFKAKETALEHAYAVSTLRAEADEPALRRLLIECLEMHYGSLDAYVAKDLTAAALGREIQAVLSRYGVG